MLTFERLGKSNFRRFILLVIIVPQFFACANKYSLTKINSSSHNVDTFVSYPGNATALREILHDQLNRNVFPDDHTTLPKSYRTRL